MALGRDGEDRAAAWYVAQGYQIVERNWRSRLGEVDLVCARHNVLVFCEVKARRTDQHGAPAEAVTRTKQLRLRRLAAEAMATLYAIRAHRAVEEAFVEAQAGPVP